jgi:DNA-binding transcriptional ArsR family regulator
MLARMDAAIAAAARALHAGDPLAALKRVALRQDADALALRGIAMAQLGELARARELLRRAARAFGPRQSLPRARCLAALAEVALAARDLAAAAQALDDARRVFVAHGDHQNATHAGLLRLRRLLLLGRIEQAAQGIDELPRTGVPRLMAIADLIAFEIAVRRGRAGAAQAALAAARDAAARSGVGALIAEVDRAAQTLTLPAARLIAGGATEPLALAGVEAVLASPDLIVDGCRRTAHQSGQSVSFARRPVLFALLGALAEAWPDEAPRDQLIERAFGARRINASHRARLRVELGRLRQQLRGFADIQATAAGFVMRPRRASTQVRVLAPPLESPDAAALALLADGEAWSTSALALALDASQRTVQRALAALEQAGQVRALGAGRSRRWLAMPVTGIATTLLLPIAGDVG